MGYFSQYNKEYSLLFRGFAMLAVMAALVVLPATSQAYTASKSASHDKSAELVIDMDQGTVVHARNASELRHPASLTKMMTLYLTFEALEQKKFSLRTKLSASKHAASMPRSNLALKRGDRIRVDDAIRALVVKSANDVAVVLAEAIGGSEYRFAKKMTDKARALGMSRTTFKNASGLHDEDQVTTARDMAILGMALKKHYPQYYSYFKTREFTYNGKTIKGHNRVLKQYVGAEGMKTGYVRASGFNLVTSAKRSGHTLMAVVLGGETSRVRDARMMELLDQAYYRVAGLPPATRVALADKKASKRKSRKRYSSKRRSKKYSVARKR